LGTAAQVANQPYTAYTGETVAGLTPDQLAGRQMIQDTATAQQPLINAGQSQLTSTLSGQGLLSAPSATNPYAGQNPYLDQMIEAASGDITRAFDKSAAGVNTQFASAGAFGGSAHQQSINDANRTLADQLSRSSNDLRFQDYQTQQQLAENQIGREYGAWDAERGREMQALGLLPQTLQAGYAPGQALYGVGSQQQALDQAQLDSKLSQWLEQRDWQKNQLGVLGNALNSINGGFQTGSTTGLNPNYQSPLGSAAGGALAGSAFGPWGALIGAGVGLLSDKRAKDTDGNLPSKKALAAVTRMPVDRWTYKGDRTPHVGTYAQNFNRNLGLPQRPVIDPVDYFGALTGAVQELDKRTRRKAA
jgi:hypothetical protein